MSGRSILYNAKVASHEDLPKQPSRSPSNKNRIINLDLNLEWDTIKAQILTAVAASLSPDILDFKDYEVQYTIPRVVTTTTALLGEDDYTTMQEVIKSSNSAKAVNVFVCPKKVRRYSLSCIDAVGSFYHLAELEA